MTTIKFGEIEEHIDEIDFKYRQFNNFDTHDHTPNDHNFYRMFDLKTNKLITKESFHSIIEPELSRLAENTPDWAFVRSYKDRPDLMRAALVGPPKTSYHNCLFFFDIEFSRNYPSKPPRVHYRSFGLELNPNLRPDGKVTLPALSEPKLSCLVSSNETWDPDEPDLLRVFRSIRDSLSTTRGNNNKRVFVLACQQMVKTIREPPSDFREFVWGHFRKCAHSVMMRFREGKFHDSVAMVDLFVKMFQVFEGKDVRAHCKHHLCVLRSPEKKVVGIDYEAKIRELEGTKMDDATTTIISKQDRYQDQGIFDRIWSWI